MGLFRYVNAVFPEITNIFASLERSVVRSSVIPSAKYCCSRSSLRFVKGRTTIDRRGAAMGGEIEPLGDTLALGKTAMPLGRNAQTRIDLAMIFTLCSPTASTA